MSLLGSVSAEVKGLLAIAQDEARALGHGYIGTEHLLIALLGQPETPGVREAVAQGANPAEARRHAEAVFAQTEDAAGFVADEEALAAVGVDLAEVRRKAEEDFGTGALKMRAGAPAFTPRAKLALEQAAEVAKSLQRAVVGRDDVLLGMLGDRDSVAHSALTEMCGDLDAVSRAARGK